jgi:ferritin-like protein
MSKSELNALDHIKLIPRNAPALRKSRDKNPMPHLVAGNPVSTRLESGIGNCFPGLECDLRNLERRFFPFLEMDMPGNEITLVRVDLDGAVAARRKGEITQEALSAYTTLAAGGEWVIETLAGSFGSLGQLKLTMTDLGTPSNGARRRPPDPWTAVRLLTEDTDVHIVLRRTPIKKGEEKVSLTGKRARYFGEDGALATMFLPGELTQSLCSPWTHDFRDCACFYWASNHPDIALPPFPSNPTNDPKWYKAVPWERSDRTIDKLPDPATYSDPTPIELRHYEINRRWQVLSFVIERREQLGPYEQQHFAGKPLANVQVLETHLRYAAGVELAVVQEYLAAAFSLKSAEELSGRLRDDVRAAHSEIMRIAIGEMRHLRAVNDVLASLIKRPAYKPALGVATKIPGVKLGTYVPVRPQPLTKDALKSFINVEAPSESVDGVYADILATLEQDSSSEEIQAIRTVMAEGEDHYRTFLAIQEWLLPYTHDEYLRIVDVKEPPDDEEYRVLQEQYAALLDLLYNAYKTGMPQGAAELNTARNAMIGKGGIVAAAEAVARKGTLVTFVTPKDPRFTPVAPPL